MTSSGFCAALVRATLSYLNVATTQEVRVEHGFIESALYIVGYFVVSLVGLAASFTPAQLNEFSKNAHVREALTDQAAAFIFAPGRGEASAESNCRYLAKVRPLAGTG